MQCVRHRHRLQNMRFRVGQTAQPAHKRNSLLMLLLLLLLEIDQVLAEQ